MRTMHDGVTVNDLPANATMVAAYVDGQYANAHTMRQRFPHAKLVTITVTGQAGANVIDCEPGDVGPGTAAKWARAEVEAGRHPTIYCMASEWGLVKAAVRKQGIAGKVNYWIADYDGKPEVPAGAVAKQYLGSPGNSPGHYDVSVVADHWPGVDPDPKPSQQPAPLAPETAAALQLVETHFTARLHAGQKLPVSDQADRVLVRTVMALCKQVLQLP